MPSDLAFGQEVIYVAGGDGLSIWTHDQALGQAVRSGRGRQGIVERSWDLDRTRMKTSISRSSIAR